MHWIIRHVPSGCYVCSTRISVRNSEFARKFNSVRQARIFLRRSNFPKDECIVETYITENHRRYGSTDDVAEYIRYNFFGADPDYKLKIPAGLAK